MPSFGLKKSSDFRKMIPGFPGCVCSYCPIASAIGTRVLLDGGNAIDAAVATGLALAVSYPQAGNLGGGGFMTLKVPGQAPQFLDFRETAPSGVRASMFLTPDGKTSAATVTGPLSVAVPGTVAGLAEAVRRFGSWSFEKIVEQVIDLAEVGVRITNRQAHYVSIYKEALQEYESTAKVFFGTTGFKPGDRFMQPDLAATLRALASDGPEAFYSGVIGKRIARELQAHGGVLTEDDMASYKPVWREPLERTFFGKKIVSAGFPSGGGFVVLKSLGLLEASGIAETAPRTLERYELLVRVFRAAFKSRGMYAGDPDHIAPEILAKARTIATQEYHADSLRELEVSEGLLQNYETEGEMPPRNTTHFCAMDRSGNAVSVTYSLNTLFGSKFICDGTGVILNNSIDDFGVAPGVPNWYSLYEGEHNILKPGARPVGSMAPTLVLDENDACEVAIGASGGPRIPTLVSQVLVGMLVDKLGLSQAVSAGRVHHQHLPSEIHLEDSVGWAMAEELEKTGNRVSVFPRLGIGAGIHYSAEGDCYSATLDKRF